MRELTQALRVKARLYAAVEPEQVQAVAARLRELEHDTALVVASFCIAIFDGDAAYCDAALRKVLEDNPAWVHDTFHRRWDRGLSVDLPSMIVARMQWLRRYRMQAVAGPEVARAGR